MPEAPVYEYRLFQPDKRQIRPARQILPVQAKTVTQCVRHLSYKPFGPCVLAAYSTHIRTSALRAKLVQT